MGLLTNVFRFLEVSPPKGGQDLYVLLPVLIIAQVASLAVTIYVFVSLMRNEVKDDNLSQRAVRVSFVLAFLASLSVNVPNLAYEGFGWYDGLNLMCCLAVVFYAPALHKREMQRIGVHQEP